MAFESALFPGYFLRVDGPGRPAILESIGHRAFGVTQLIGQFIIRVMVRYLFDFHDTLLQKYYIVCYRTGFISCRSLKATPVKELFRLSVGKWHLL